MMRHIIHGEMRDGATLRVQNINIAAGEVHYNVLPESISRVDPSITAPVHTLSLEEVEDAGREGVDVVDVVTSHAGLPVATYANKDGAWYWTTSRTAIASGLFERVYDVHPADETMAAALDRVVAYWRLVCRRDLAAACVAEHLGHALTAARAHVAAFARVGDALPVEVAADLRRMSTGLSYHIKDIERLLNTYKHHGDVL